MMILKIVLLLIHFIACLALGVYLARGVMYTHGKKWKWWVLLIYALAILWVQSDMFFDIVFSL